ncbi:Mini zinc finger protein 1 [Striga hermonthica]|uniref:Mini zinc finger protein 1 n=1 Tax=Striga hermonthica TaxID=68872 RepID=A0A9N7R3N5_STRHE|nr:Mini zinc finger protein 1 [Striga hermonthica]
MGGGDTVSYGECLKLHSALENKADGRQEFIPVGGDYPMDCTACGCHRKVIWRVLHTVCQKNHNPMGPESKDGCQEFKSFPGNHHLQVEACAACGCHVSFHMKEKKRKPK